MFHKYITECLGTFFLVLTIGCTVNVSPLASLAIGSILIALIYAGAHTSGAHYNPAVTLGVWFRRRMATSDVFPYMGSQALGAVLAALVVLVLQGYSPWTLLLNASFEFRGTYLAVIPALLAEFLFTFALVFVVLNVATSRATSGNSYYGAAIGLTLLAGIIAVGNISSAAFNPAVALGAAVMGLIAWQQIWIFLVANFLGAVAAAVMFDYLNPTDR